MGTGWLLLQLLLIALVFFVARVSKDGQVSSVLNMSTAILFALWLLEVFQRIHAES
jgi:hypothetical protein